MQGVDTIILTHCKMLSQGQPGKQGPSGSSGENGLPGNDGNPGLPGEIGPMVSSHLQPFQWWIHNKHYV